MAYKYILYEKQDKIARITLNRPEVLNALSNALLNELAAALDEIDKDNGVSVVIIKGAGRGFSAR
jgi:enoyl-CoA hydratase/carnithine racemase